MKVAFYLNIVSPHQLPLAQAVAERVGAENFIYIYAEDFHAERANMGWCDKVEGLRVEKLSDENFKLLDSSDIVYTGIRCPSLMARRFVAGKMTVYYSERWFKPIPFLGVLLPGWLRMLSPRYCKLARQMVGLLNEPSMKYLSCGPWAAKDLMSIGLRQSQVVHWGYFVEEGSGKREMGAGTRLRVLWVGRMLDWKRVDTIVRAVKRLVRSGVEISLDIYGTGPKENRLNKMVNGCEAAIKFYPPVSIAEVRNLMRDHDVYVLSSNAEEGWGAVVNEALEEGMYVIGTREAGASASMLPEESLYPCGDWKRLASLLARCVEEKRSGTLKGQGIGEWTAKIAAERLLDIAK